MLSEWAASGLPPEEFWIQTPKTYLAIMDGIVRRIRAERNHRVEVAWRTANFLLAGDKLPELQTFLIDVESGEGLDNSTHNKQHIDADDGLDAWFSVVEGLNKV